MSDAVAPWLSQDRTDWLESVSAWTRDGLAPTGIQLRSLESIKERPWGAVFGVVTASEQFVFKAMGPRGRHEARLLADIAASRPNLAPDVIAVDGGRGWVLMSYDGDPMIDVASIAQQVAMLEELLPAYAEVQQETESLVAEWAGDGVPDRSPRRLPEGLDHLLSGRGLTGPLPVDADELASFAGLMEPFDRICDQLADGPVGPMVDHADIHGTNVLVSKRGPRLIDWGDACISHPYSSLLVPIEWVAGRLDPGERSSAARRLCDAYLEPWGRDADREVAGLAMWTAYVARALSNDEQSVGGAPADVADAQQEIVALLRTWHGKRTKLGSPDELLEPAMPSSMRW